MQNGSSIPDTVIDNALVVWHSDKTKIMKLRTSFAGWGFLPGRLGTWENSNKYKLNHFAWGGNALPADPPTEMGLPS